MTVEHEIDVANEQGSATIHDLTARIGFKVDTMPLDQTVQALKAIAAAAEQAREALSKLGDFEHGGITIKMVGEMMTCEIKPPPPVITGTLVA